MIHLRVPRTRIERLAREETPITANTALRLARYFGTTPAFWMGMQAQCELERAQDGLADELRRIAPVRRVAAFQTQVVALGRLQLASIDNISESLAVAEGEAFCVGSDAALAINPPLVDGL
jgi:plasmid maintenance system antidote protein VapI